MFKWFINVSLKKSINLDISDYKIVNNILPKNNIHDKGKTLDVVATNKKRVIDLEVNASYYNTLNIRNFAYIAGKYAEEVKASETYDVSRTFIQINYTKGLSKDAPICEVYTLRGENSGKNYIDNFIVIVYNVDKAMKLWKQGNKEYSFIAMLEANEEELKLIGKEDKIMEKIKDEIIRLNKNEHFTKWMSEEEDARKVRNTLIAEAEEYGISKGVSEEKINIAKNLLNMNLSVEDITKATGLSLEEIKKLK